MRLMVRLCYRLPAGLNLQRLAQAAAVVAAAAAAVAVSI